MPPARAIRRTSASESWLPETNTNGWPILDDPLHERVLERRAARGEVSREEERPPSHRAVEGGKGEQVVVQVRCQDEVVEVAPGLAPRAGGHEPREPHELLVQLLRDHPRRALRLLDRPQRHRDVRAVGVVLRVGDRPARGEQQCEGEADGERGPEGGGEQPSHPRRAPAAHGERHDQPSRETEREHHQQQNRAGTTPPRRAPPLAPPPRRAADRTRGARRPAGSRSGHRWKAAPEAAPHRSGRPSPRGARKGRGRRGGRAEPRARSDPR